MSVHARSTSAYLADFKVGERRYREVTPENLRALQHAIGNANRYPKFMHEWCFTTATYRAVPTAIADPVLLLLRIERTK